MGVFENIPYTNFHELNDDWIIKTVKDMAAEWAETKEALADPKATVDKIVAFAEDYFKNLDVSPEVSAKVEEMANNGELLAIVQPYFQPIVTEQNQRLSVLESRMDEFTELPDGSTTGDAELADIRVAYDGNRYATAGDAVRAQASDLAMEQWEDLAAIPITWNNGGYINRDTGAVVSYETWSYTDFIDISECTNSYFYIKADTTDGTSYNVFYDASQQKIGDYFDSGRGPLIMVPIYQGAKYVRLSRLTTDKLFLFDDKTPDLLKFYREPSNISRCITEPIRLEHAKYTLETAPDVSIINLTDANAVISQTDYAGSREYYRATNAAYVQLAVSYNNMSALGIKSIKFYPKKEYSPVHYLKLCSFNVGLWHDGIDQQPDESAEEYTHLFRRFLGKENPDIMGLLEAPDHVDQSHTIPCIPMLTFKLPYYYTNGNNKIVAKDAPLTITKLSFGSGSGRPFFRFRYNVGNDTITVYMVHLSTEANSSGVRQQDLAELAGLLDGATKTIIMGDFNCYAMSELAVFDDYTMANGGDFGSFVTWPGVSQEWPNGCLDNIIMTNDISLQNVYIEEESFSDHYPIIAEVSLYY